MAINFPDSPSNGDTFTASGKSFVYNSTTQSWSAVTSGSAINLSSITSDILPDADSSRSLGSPTKKWKDLHLSGNTLTLGGIKLKDAGGSLKVETDAGADVSPGGSTTSYANLAAFPSSGNTAGDMVFATDTKAVYVWDGTEWDRVYTGSQTTPSFTTDPPSNLLLNTDGSNNVVTVAATDPQGFPISYEFDGVSGDSSYTESSLPPQITSLTKSNGVFTFTPSTSQSNSGTFTGRFKASDGLQTTAKSTLFQLSFGLTDVYGFDITQTSSSNGYVIFYFMFVAEDGSNLHDDSTYASEVVYGANIETNSWHEGGERSTSTADTAAQAYLRTEMLSRFNHTLPASGSGSHFNYGLVANSTVSAKTITWTTARTIKGILVTGTTSTDPRFSGGYVTPYIGGNTASDLSSTSYTLLQGSTTSAVNDRYYDFSV